ncbi:hypothetical protein Taro_026740, partial [Colocasia esculenta]|nr:hypothetical protein [Colocasia esculenta]
SPCNFPQIGGFCAISRQLRVLPQFSTFRRLFCNLCNPSLGDGEVPLFNTWVWARGAATTFGEPKAPRAKGSKSSKASKGSKPPSRWVPPVGSLVDQRWGASGWMFGPEASPWRWAKSP